jgi:uncharacterized phiE125 gp8 family phage protein
VELRQLSASAAPPIALDEAKAHLRVDHNAEDFTIETLLAAAVQHVESVTHRAIQPQVWEVTLPAPSWGHWCQVASVGLPYPPLREVTLVEALDEAGVAVVADPATYRVSAPSGPTASAGALLPSSGWAWPASRLRVTYSAGYASADDVPRALRAAILLVLGDLFENREGGSTGRAYQTNPTVERLLKPFVVSWP